MAKQTDEQIVQDSTTEALARSGEAANEMMKGNADALTEERQRLKSRRSGADQSVSGIGDKERQELDCRDAGAGRSEKPGRIY